MIEYLGKELKNHIPKKTITALNKERKWVYGYNKEYDVIIISKDGTLGSVFEAQGLKIGLPQKPKKEFIRFSEETRSNQRWKRFPVPSDSDLVELKREVKRRKEGLWVSIKGKPIYLTGLSYFFHQWIRLDEGYPNFRIIQNDLMIYWEACKADQRCYGICYVKNRRFGWSSICNAELLYSGTLSREKDLGIISKTGEDGRKMFSRLIRSFKKLPSFYIPLWDGTSTPKKELLLQTPSKRRAAGEEIDMSKESLETVIRYHNTAINAMDGDKIYRSAIDEAGKFPKEVPFDLYWSIVKTSHEQGRRIVGKAMVGSTVNAMKKGGKEFKTVFTNSDPLVRTGNDQTKSGLYALFISAEYALEGYIDSYGFSVAHDPVKAVLNDSGEMIDYGAHTHLDNTLEGLKDQPDLFNEEMRKYPRSIKEAFRDGAEECAFNLVKLIEQDEFNETIEVGYTRGNLVWKDGIRDTAVVWKPSEKGRFWIARHPAEGFENVREERAINGVTAFAPVAGHIGSFGVDPYNQSKTSDGRGSEGAISLSTKANPSELPNHAFILEYIDRPLRVEDFYEDVIKAMVYYSMPVLVELANTALLKLIKERGYRHFSMNNPLKRYVDLNPTEKLLGGAPAQNKDVGLQQFYAVETYIENHLGYAREDSYRPKGAIGYMPFERTIEQWKEVDPEKRTDHDAYISSSLSLIANQSITPKVTQVMKSFQVPFRKFKRINR